MSDQRSLVDGELTLGTLVTLPRRPLLWVSV